ncbi:MAG: FUSC family protein, partial [Solirubrobacteraceae bacterium]
NATLRSPAGRHALRLAVVVVLTELLAARLPLQRSYWVVVAAATVLRPEFAATFTRGAQRLLGTLAGVALAGGIMVALHPSLTAVAPVIGVLAWAAFAVFPASFAAGFAFVTALVVFLLDAVSAHTLTTASDRLIDTAIGGAIGLIAYALWPTWTRRSAREVLVEAIEAHRAYLAVVTSALILGGVADARALVASSRRARLAYATAQETIAQALAEPEGRRAGVEVDQSMLGMLRRLGGATHVLRICAEEPDREPMPAITALTAELERSLRRTAAKLRDASPVPAAEPPTLKPPTLKPPTLERPTLERPTLEPPTLERPTLEPPTAEASLRLRERYAELRRAGEGSQDDGIVERELDELVDATNSLAALVPPY